MGRLMMDRMIVKMLPAAIRDAYGAEIAEMLSDSKRPIRDRCDVSVTGVGLRLGASASALLAAAILATCASLLAVVHAVRNLQFGIREMPDHWWSTFIAGGFVMSVSLAIVVFFARQRAAVWHHDH